MWSSTPPIDGRKKSLSIKTQCFRRATTGDDADVDGASSASFGARRARVMARARRRARRRGAKVSRRREKV